MNKVLETLSTNIGRLVLFLSAPVISGVLLVLAFPKYDLQWVAWIALAPLLIVIAGRSLKHGFFLSYLCGIIFFFLVFKWTFSIPAYKFHHHLTLGLYLGLYFGLFGLTINFISKRWGMTIALSVSPFIWVSLEYVRSSFFFLALPWSLLAHSQYRFIPIIQISSLTGAYGVSFLIVMVNAVIALSILSFLSHVQLYNIPASYDLSNRVTFIAIIVTGTLLSLTFLYGFIILSLPNTGARIKVSIIQGNIDQARKHQPGKHSEFIMGRYSDLTRAAAKDRPQLIVWPEASTPGYILKNLALQKQINTLIREVKTHFLIGSTEYPKFAEPDADGKKLGNTALFFSPFGDFLGQYLKIHLVPFGEYLPYEGTIRWPYFIVPKEKLKKSEGLDFLSLPFDS